MVALNEQLHYPGARPGLQGTGVGRAFRSWELGVLSTDQGTLTTDQYCRSDDIFIDHYSLVIERSAGANDIIYCGYPDSNRVSTDIGTGLNAPESELYYVRNRTYSSVPDTVLRQEPKSRQATGVATRVLQRDPIGYAGGINLYEYVGGRADAAVDPMVLAGETGSNGTAPPNPWNPPPGPQIWPWPPTAFYSSADTRAVCFAVGQNVPP